MFLVEQELREQRSNRPSCQAQGEGKGREKVHTCPQTMRHSGDWGKTSRRACSPQAPQAGEELNKNRNSRDQRQEEKNRTRRQIIESSQKRWKTILSSFFFFFKFSVLQANNYSNRGRKRSPCGAEWGMQVRAQSEDNELVSLECGV